MVGVIAAAMIAAVIALLEMPAMNKKKEKVVFLGLLISGFLLISVVSLGFPVPNPAEWAAVILRPAAAIISNILGKPTMP